MATLETIRLSHMPVDMPVFAALFRDVTNSAWLREQLLQGNEEFEYAFIDASMVLSRRHALAAVFRAMNDYLNDRLKSRNVHSEIVFALSSNNNIGEAFRRFGISDTTTNLLVFKVANRSDVNMDGVQKHLNEYVHGQPVPFDDETLKETTDVARVRKVHKLGAIQVSSGKKGEGGRIGEGEVEVQVLGLMALRGAA